MKLFRRILALAALLLLAACASTPESRIKKNPALFASFPADTQAMIQKGQVDIGFTPEMVEMAKGPANRTYQRRTATGTADVWSYTGIRYTTERQRVEARFRAPDAGGSWRSYTEWVWVDVQRQTEFDELRIEFADGKVSAIESANG